MKARQVSVVLLVTGLLVPRAARAEDASALPTLTPGQRIRFATATEPRRTATLIETDGEVLVVRIAGQGDAVRVPLADMQRLEVSAGRHSYASQGALIGAIPGVAFGGLVGAYATCFDMPDCSGVPGALLGAALVGTVTMAAGAGIGALIKTERWQKAAPIHAALQLAPTRGGMAVGLKVSF
jgi:hypothetical protein